MPDFHCYTGIYLWACMYGLLLGKRFLLWNKYTLKSKVTVIYTWVGCCFLGGRGVLLCGFFFFSFWGLLVLFFLAEYKVSGSHLGRFETVNY